MGVISFSRFGFKALKPIDTLSVEDRGIALGNLASFLVQKT